MKVLKFGGTSVGSAERMKNLVEIIQPGEAKIVVLSAMSGTTDRLVEINEAAKNNNVEEVEILISQLKDRHLQTVEELYENKKSIQSANQIISGIIDLLHSEIKNYRIPVSEKIIVAQGEILSTSLFQILLEERKISSCLLSALDFMKIDKIREANIGFIKENLAKQLKKNEGFQIYVTQGFICKNDKNEIDNLGRGGSDYTASLIGGALVSEEIQIWTDIDGMHNNDPRIIENTRPIRELSYDEAAELAYFGAKILHPSTIRPAKLAKVPVRLKNTLQPEDEGTLINENNDGVGFKAVAAKDNIIAIKIKSGRMLMAYGFIRKVFEVFENYKTSIDMVTTSEVAISMTIDDKTFLKEIVSELEKLGIVTVDQNQTIVAVVGELMAEQKGYARQLFSALREVPIRMISYGASKNNISILVNTSDKIRTLQAIHHGVFNKYAGGI